MRLRRLDHPCLRTAAGTPARRRGFTLVEMLVACAIIAGALGMLMSGLAVSQRRSNAFATNAVIRAVHEICLRAAREEGSTTLVRGFTIDYSGAVGSPVPGSRSAPGIRPWVLDGVAGSAVVKDQDEMDLAGDLGRRELWSGDSMGFIDRLRPAGQVEIAGAALPTGTWRYLHVAYEPRSGFVHAVASTDADPKPADLACDVITLYTAAPTAVSIPLCGLGDGREKLRVVISATGVADVRAP